MNRLRIVFMGTPEFAVPSLEILAANGFEIAAVITAPDKPAGRGQALGVSPVKTAALRLGLRVLQPANLKDQDFLSLLKSLDAALQVVVAFRMLPEAVWNMPARGTFNLHASLLPAYRGAAPINWAIINGESETGVTTFLLKQEIDTGSILFQEREPIREDDTAGTLYERLMIKGASLVLKTTQAIEAGTFAPQPQREGSAVTHAPKIFRETCRINWSAPSAHVLNFIRGLSPYPAAWTDFNGKTYKIFASGHTVIADDGEPGTRLSDGKTFLHVRCSDGWISVLELQAEGKKRMTISDFFKGNRI